MSVHKTYSPVLSSLPEPFCIAKQESDTATPGWVGSEVMIQRWISLALSKKAAPASMLDYLPNNRSKAVKL
jgi:hypothetical protein